MDYYDKYWKKHAQNAISNILFSKLKNYTFTLYETLKVAGKKPPSSLRTSVVLTIFLVIVIGSI